MGKSVGEKLKKHRGKNKGVGGAGIIFVGKGGGRGELMYFFHKFIIHVEIRLNFFTSSYYGFALKIIPFNALLYKASVVKNLG